MSTPKKQAYYRAGDWVRFYKDRILVIGVIQYIGEPDVLGYKELQTDIGVIDEKDVLEARRLP